MQIKKEQIVYCNRQTRAIELTPMKYDDLCVRVVDQRIFSHLSIIDSESDDQIVIETDKPIIISGVYAFGNSEDFQLDKYWGSLEFREEQMEFAMAGWNNDQLDPKLPLPPFLMKAHEYATFRFFNEHATERAAVIILSILDIRTEAEKEATA